MFSRPTHGAAVATRALLNDKTTSRDAETWLAETLERTRGETDVQTFRERPAAIPRQSNRIAELQCRLTAEEMIRAIEERLPTRIRELAIDGHDGVFTLRGVSSSYYAKQLAGHLAMRAMEARMLGRVLNEIEVRAAARL